MHEFVHLDGKIIATLKLLFGKPGQLTVEHLQGRRARYIGAIRLYLTISAIYFILAAVIPNPNPNAAGDQPVPTDTRSADSRQSGFRGRVSAGLIITSRRGEYFNELLGHTFPKAMFVLVPVFAVLVRLVHRDRVRQYPQFLYFSLHFHAAAFGFLVLTLPLQALQSETPLTIAEVVVMLVVFVYFVQALRRVFGGSRSLAIRRAIAVAVMYGITVVAAVAVTIIAVLYRLGT